MSNKTYIPNIYSKNHSVSSLRLQKKEVDPKKRYPLGKFPFRSVISFGSRTRQCISKIAEIDKEDGIVLNRPETIARASDKVVCKQILEELKIPTPKFQTMESLLNDNETKFLTKNLELSFPMVVKLRKGSGGRDMKRIDTLDELKDWRKGKSIKELKRFFIEEIFQPDLKLSCEYRITVSPWLVSTRFEHIEVDPKTEKEVKITSTLGDFVILRKKMRQNAVESGEFGRNIALGNSFFTRKFKRETTKGGHPLCLDKITDLCVLACQGLELDFCAADVLFDVETGKWTIIELNTAPSMGSTDEGNTYTLSQWKKALPIILMEKARATLPVEKLDTLD